MTSRLRTIILLLLAEVAAMSLWFVSAAVLPDLAKSILLSDFQQAALSSSVQLGFVAGALASAILGIADRFDPRRVFFFSASIAAAANASILLIQFSIEIAIVARFVTGALLAGVYPVGMKIMVGWSKADRGFLIGALVGALTLGSALPHLMAIGGGADWQLTVILASLAAFLGGGLVMLTQLGPDHGQAPRLNPAALLSAWHNKRVRYAYGGYFGHMWELYAMWAWIGVAASHSYAQTLSSETALLYAKWTAFIAIAAGGIACAVAGKWADRIGKEEVTILSMAVSGSAAVAVALSFGGPVWLTAILIVIWGIFIVPDSAQFSALVADAAPAHEAGSLMTFQTAIGFALTFATVQLTPVLAAAVGWPLVLASLALGPAFGIASMMRLRRLRLNSRSTT